MTEKQESKIADNPFVPIHSGNSYLSVADMILRSGKNVSRTFAGNVASGYIQINGTEVYLSSDKGHSWRPFGCVIWTQKGFLISTSEGRYIGSRQQAEKTLTGTRRAFLLTFREYSEKELNKFSGV